METTPYRLMKLETSMLMVEFQRLPSVQPKYATVTDADQMDTAPTPGAVITTEAKDSKGASSWVPEQHHTQIVMQDTPDFEGVGPITQHKSCIKPTAAVAIDPAADQKGAVVSADPDPDQVTAVAASAADGVSSTEETPAVCDDNPSPMKDIDHDEGILVDVTPTPTLKKLELAQQCPAPVYKTQDPLPRKEGGPTTQTESCTKPTAKAAADQKGAEPSTQSNPDPDQMISAAADDMNMTEITLSGAAITSSHETSKATSYNEFIAVNRSPTLINAHTKEGPQDKDEA